MAHSLQDFAVDESVASLFTYLCIWHIQLWDIHPVLAIVPLVIFGFLVHFFASATGESLRMDAARETQV